MASVNITPKNKLLISVKIESGARGPKGDIGLTPQLNVLSTITGAPDTPANVVLGGTPENPTLTFTIPTGRPFDIAARYNSVSDLISNTNPNPSGYEKELFDLAIIQSNVEDEDNARLYIFDNNPTPGKGGWTFISDLSGATGPRRELRFRPGTLILEWLDNDGVTWIEGKNLALEFDFEVDSSNQLLLTVKDSAEEESETINLTATAEFGDGQNASVTSVKFINNNNTETSFQELGVYASFNGTELTLTNPDTTTVQQELSLSFDWDDTSLGIKTPTDQNFTYQKLSPDIAFDTSNGVQISVVEPDAAQNLIKISPDISFQNIGNGLELSIVEPGVTSSFNKVSPDIYFDGTKIAIVEPEATPTPGDYTELGFTAEFGAGETTITTLTVVNPESTVEQELGVYGEFGGEELSDTTLVLTNPDGTTEEQELGVYASFDSEVSDTILILTNPDNTTVEQELGVYASFDEEDITKVIFTNPDDTTIEQELGVYGSFDSQQSATTLVITNPDEQTVEQELGVYAEWGTIQQGTNRTLTLTNPDNQQISRDLGIEFDWDGTQLGIKTADDQDFTYVDLKGETGDASAPGTPLFKLRDEVDTAGNGLQISSNDEIQFIGSAGIEVKRSDKIYTIKLIEIDGGTFLEPTPTPE